SAPPSPLQPATAASRTVARAKQDVRIGIGDLSGCQSYGNSCQARFFFGPKFVPGTIFLADGGLRAPAGERAVVFCGCRAGVSANDQRRCERRRRQRIVELREHAARGRRSEEHTSELQS